MLTSVPSTLILRPTNTFMTRESVFEDDWLDVIPVAYKRDFDYPYARNWWTRHRAIERPWASELDRLLDAQFGIEEE